MFFLEGSPRWALEENERALQVTPSGAGWFLHGQCHAAMDDHVQAETCYQRGLEVDDCSRGRHLLARCLEQAGRHEQAVEQYRRAARMAEGLEGNTMLIAEIKADLSALLDRIRE